MAEARRTFAPVVLLGLASAGLAAVAGNRDWASSTANTTLVLGDSSAKAPLAGALALVVLACWGVLLVTRGGVRRAVAVLATVAALGVLATVLLGYGATADGLRDSLQQPDADVSRTGWWWVCLVASVLGVVASVAAVRFAPSWPAMGSRYDAPGAAPPPREETSLDLWRAMDDGRDPTLPPERSTDP